jgi:transcriptional antiterminator RfaH
MSSVSANQPSWYVVQTQPNREARAALELIKQDFQVFAPRYLRQKRHARRVTTVPAPLFPGYVFVAFDPDACRWRAINGTVGVVRLIATADRPAPVDRAVVHELMARTDTSGHIPMASKKRFEPGDAIRLSGGGFEDQLGLFVEFSDRDRVAILLDLLGRKVRVVVSDDRVHNAA